jgi:hypothetical protein
MNFSASTQLKLLADGLALVYHEARHARHLVKAGYISPAGWEHILGLPANRVEAWRTVQAVRQAAGEAENASNAAGCFEQRFKKSVDDLEELYTNPHWRHASAVGGHAWRGVAAAVSGLRDAIERAETSDVEIAAESLVAARHNNGPIRQKVKELDALIGVQSGDWWQCFSGT